MAQEAANLPSPLPRALAEPTRLPLGSLLLRDGILTAEQLEQALTEKDATGHRREGSGSVHACGVGLRPRASSTSGGFASDPHAPPEAAANAGAFVEAGCPRAGTAQPPPRALPGPMACVR